MPELAMQLLHPFGNLLAWPAVGASQWMSSWSSCNATATSDADPDLDPDSGWIPIKPSQTPTLIETQGS
jgi:hypothetical protein